jgi:hypothetical protein
MLHGQVELSDTVDGLASMNAADDRSGLLDVTEVAMRWRPIPDGPWRTTVRAGIFFPAISWENNGPGWTSTRTISTSAVNTWIGEELRTKGIEWSILRRGQATGDAYDLGFSAAVFNGNDATGTLLTWRGWTIADRITGLREALRLPDLPVYSPAGDIPLQTRTIHPFREIDGRFGYQLGARYAYGGWLELTGMHYDNRADPLIVKDGQYSWRTDLQHVGVRVRKQAWEFLMQSMNGSTRMGPDAAGVRFRAWYVLASHSAGANRITGRYDRFRNHERDLLQSDPNGESGTAWTISYVRTLSPALEFVLEALTVQSSRAGRSLIGEPVSSSERSLTTSVRWRF